MSFKPLVTSNGPITTSAAALCLPLMAKTGELLLTEIRQAKALRVDMLEWRVDALQSLQASADLFSLAAQVRHEAHGLPLILTLRSAAEGGGATGLSDSARADLLLALVPYAKPEFIDIELAMAPSDFLRVQAACRAAAIQLIVSSHDFKRTASQDRLLSSFMRAKELGADVSKLAAHPNDFDDVLRLMTVTRQAATQLDIPVIGISMGELGVVSRVFATECGSALTFVAGSEASAPGQLALARYRQLRQLLTL